MSSSNNSFFSSCFSSRPAYPKKPPAEITPEQKAKTIKSKKHRGSDDAPPQLPHREYTEGQDSVVAYSLNSDTSTTSSDEEKPPRRKKKNKFRRNAWPPTSSINSTADEDGTQVSPPSIPMSLQSTSAMPVSPPSAATSPSSFTTGSTAPADSTVLTMPHSLSMESVITPPLVLNTDDRKQDDSVCARFSEWVVYLSLRFATPIRVTGTVLGGLNAYFSTTNFMVLVSKFAGNELSDRDASVLTMGGFGAGLQSIFSWVGIGEGLHYQAINKGKMDQLEKAVITLTSNQTILGTALVQERDRRREREREFKRVNRIKDQKIRRLELADAQKDQRIRQLEQQLSLAQGQLPDHPGTVVPKPLEKKKRLATLPPLLSVFRPSSRKTMTAPRVPPAPVPFPLERSDAQRNLHPESAYSPRSPTRSLQKPTD